MEAMQYGNQPTPYAIEHYWGAYLGLDPSKYYVSRYNRVERSKTVMAGPFDTYEECREEYLELMAIYRGGR
jgi:hypothetical protein